MKTVFIDTNVILDVLLQDEGFWQDSLKIFKHAELGQINACISASSMTDVFYVVRKKLTIQVARDAVEKLLNLFTIVAVAGDDLRGALTLPIEDMEDALQAWCAIKIKAEMLITRDIGGFANIELPVITPSDFTV